MNDKQYKYLGVVTISNELVHLGKDDDYLYSGVVTNVGFAEQDDYKIDHDISLDQNIQDFVEFMEEESDNS